MREVRFLANGTEVSTPRSAVETDWDHEVAGEPLPERAHRQPQPGHVGRSPQGQATPDGVIPTNPAHTSARMRFTATIGEGGGGDVVGVRDARLDRDVALKVLPQAFTEEP